MNTVRVKLFAVAADVAGRDTVDIDLSPTATIAELRRALAEKIPELKEIVDHSMFAVDAEYAGDDRLVPPSADVACIPPVSGG